MMSMADPIAIGVETLRIDSGCSLEKDFTELIDRRKNTVVECANLHIKQIYTQLFKSDF